MLTYHSYLESMLQRCCSRKGNCGSVGKCILQNLWIHIPNPSHSIIYEGIPAVLGSARRIKSRIYRQAFACHVNRRVLLSGSWLYTLPSWIKEMDLCRTILAIYSFWEGETSHVNNPNSMSIDYSPPILLDIRRCRLDSGWYAPTNGDANGFPSWPGKFAKDRNTTGGNAQKIVGNDNRAEYSVFNWFGDAFLDCKFKKLAHT